MSLHAGRLESKDESKDDHVIGVAEGGDRTVYGSAGGSMPMKRRKRGRLQRGPGTVWKSKFALKSRVQRRALIQQPWKYPVASQNLAAIEIQRSARGFLTRSGSAARLADQPRKASLREKYELKVLAEREKRMQAVHDKEYDIWCRERLQAWWRMLLVRREYERNRFSLYHIAAMQIQYLWKAYTREMYLSLSRPPLRVIAAQVLQRAWRRYTNLRIFRYYRDLIRFRNTGDPALMLRSINPREASLVDRASGMRVRFRLGGDTFPPQIYYKIFTRAALCDVGAFAPRDYTRVRGVNAAQRHNRAINPPLEGHGPDDDRIVDAAIDAGTGLVLNLGRTTQVSRISRAALELTSGADAATGGVGAAGRSGKGAFASVNVAADMVQQYEAGMAPEGWYRRRENNGWRPVSLKTLEEADKDPVTVATNRLAKSFHFSKVKRREDALRQRKLKKRKWLMKMYREGLAKERGGGGGKEGEAEEAAATNHGKTGGSLEDVLDLEDDEWEDNAEHLLKWSTALDFDSYVADWQAVGTSGLPPEVPSDDVDSALDRGSHTYSAGSFSQGGGIGATTVIHQGTGYVEMY